MNNWKDKTRYAMLCDRKGALDASVDEPYTSHYQDELITYLEAVFDEERERTVDAILLEISEMEIEKAGNSAHTMHQIEVLIDSWYAKKREEYLKSKVTEFGNIKVEEKDKKK